MIQRPRGTKDIYGQDENIYSFIFKTFESLAKTYNLRKIITPTFESLELFKDSTGESSDIVTKEIYRFKDQSDRELALKPEGTASVGRAILENKLYASKEYNKLYYIDSMYRYEKPQKGRLRQFFQIGVEITNELSISSIVDSLMLSSSLLKKLNIDDYVLNINSIGSNEERQKYIEELKKYFNENKLSLSELSQKRIDINPLRILDDKEDSKLDVVKNAPKICDYWSQETKEEFNKVLEALDKLNIKYEINYSLVRGLDYYSNIVFEYVSNSKALGSKVTIIGGGCYQDLIKNDENKVINGVGFGVGVERIFEILKDKNSLGDLSNKIDVQFLIENDNQYLEIYPIINELRLIDICVEYNYTLRKFKKLLDEAIKSDVSLIIFQELRQQGTNKWTIKNDGTNIEINKDELINKIKEMLKRG